MYVFRFYTNGRFIVYKGGKEVKRGTYSDGGQKMAIDGAGSFSGTYPLANAGKIIKWIDSGAKTSSPSQSDTLVGLK